MGMSEIANYFEKEELTVDDSRCCVAYLEGSTADRALKEKIED